MILGMGRFFDRDTFVLGAMNLHMVPLNSPWMVQDLLKERYAAEPTTITAKAAAEVEAHAIQITTVEKNITVSEERAKPMVVVAQTWTV